MHCSQCGADNRETAKFCDSCGSFLRADAPAVGVEGARSASVSGERRHVTVLFCDLVNSTNIAAQLDPEEWREIVAAYHRAAAQAIERFGGHVAQYLGDGVMAYFGWPEAHDNAAESAALAGLAIVEQNPDESASNARQLMSMLQESRRRLQRTPDRMILCRRFGL
jgi:class 3 adenylate cyclase